MNAGGDAYFSAVSSRSSHLLCHRSHSHDHRLSRQLELVLQGRRQASQDAPKFLSHASHTGGPQAALSLPFPSPGPPALPGPAPGAPERRAAPQGLHLRKNFRSGARRARAEGGAAASPAPQPVNGRVHLLTAALQSPRLLLTARFSRCLQRKLFTGFLHRQSR